MSDYKSTVQDKKIIVVAGASGHLGGRIVHYLLELGASVRAIIRPGSARSKIEALQKQGAVLVEADFSNANQLKQACLGAACVVSALSGLREVMVETQTRLLEAAVAAGVPRFIPSDFAIDFTKLPRGTNRNLDLRLEFQEQLERAPIAATSVLNGMFTDLLLGPAPVILFPLRRVVYWGSADQLLDFTTLENTAAYTAAAALDPHTPRYLRIAGEEISARGLVAAASAVTGQKFRLLRAGSLNRLDTIINITRTLFPQKEEVFPAWQGMQYLRNMFSGLPKLKPLDNDRYRGISWTSVREVLTKRIS